MIQLALACLLAVSGSAPSEADQDRLPLEDAIAAFNASAIEHEFGRNERPLSEQEVVGAILLWSRPDSAPVSDELLNQFQSIARSKELPANASFEVLTGYDRGGDHVFDVWSVRIRLERSDGSSYAFIIRERVIGSRTLQQELERLEKIVAAQPEKLRQIGSYRLSDRIDRLKARIVEAGANR